MRLSVKKKDPGFSPHAYRYKAYLDGKKAERCFTADEEKGFVDVYRMDADNGYMVKCGELQTERRYGKVELRLPDKTRNYLKPGTT